MLRSLRPFASAVVALACAFGPPLVLGPTTNAGLTGNWIGILDVVHADGSVAPDNAYFSLIQDGAAITGTAGNSSSHMSAISGGQLAGNNLSFDIVVNPQITVKFNLLVDADRLHGTATGLPADPGSNIVVDVRRADAGWHSASTVAHIRDQLFDTVAGLDRRLFDAYNTCDLPTLGAMVADDLEFYHDKTGLAVGKQSFVDSIRNNICGKTQRVLVPGSVEVYRLDHYGAVEMGRHRFTHPGHEELGIGEAKFITLWQFKNGEWKVARVISYDHESARE
ncbi:MAG: nuclear transport factor 2 family protein [Acidobacteriaceae bacterium]